MGKERKGGVRWGRERKERRKKDEGEARGEKIWPQNTTTTITSITTITIPCSLKLDSV